MHRATEYRTLAKLGLKKEVADMRLVRVASDLVEAYGMLKSQQDEIEDLQRLLDNQRSEVKHAQSKVRQMEAQLAAKEVQVGKFLNFLDLLKSYNITNKQELAAALEASQKP